MAKTSCFGMVPSFGCSVLFYLIILGGGQIHSADHNEFATESPDHAKTEMDTLTEPVIDLTTLSLQDFCLLFDILEENCTCDQVINSLTGKSFCETKNETIISLRNITRKSLLSRNDKALDSLQASLTLTASILAIIGNSLVIIVSVGNRKELGKCKFLIAVLAFTDVCFAVTQLVVSVPMLWTPRWIYGGLACRLLPPMYSLGAVIAMGNITIIAVERYIGIVHPLKHGLSWKMTYILLAVNAVFCFLAVLPQAIVGQITAQGTCQEAWPRGNRDSLIYSWFILVAFFVLPCVIVLFLYAVIIQTLLANARTAASLSLQDSHVGKKRQADNQRIMLILVCVLLAFIILVLPNRLVWVVFDMVGDLNNLSDATYKAWVYAGVLPYPFHVAANPIIYSAVDAKFRRDVTRLCPCFRKANKAKLNRVETKSTNDAELTSNHRQMNELRPVNSTSNLLKDANSNDAVGEKSLETPQKRRSGNLSQQLHSKTNNKKISTASQKKGYSPLDEDAEVANRCETKGAI